MARIGYARISILEQDLATQRAALKDAGCDPIRVDRVSRASTTGRGELDIVLDHIGTGDTLVVTRLDRLARSISDLQDIVRILIARGATLQAIEQPIDTSTSIGPAFRVMLGVFAEFEKRLRSERQREDSARAKAAGLPRGRPPSIDPVRVRALSAEGLKPIEIAHTLSIAPASVYRILAATSSEAGAPAHDPDAV